MLERGFEFEGRVLAALAGAVVDTAFVRFEDCGVVVDVFGGGGEIASGFEFDEGVEGFP